MEIMVENAKQLKFFEKGKDLNKVSFLDPFVLLDFDGFTGVVTNYNREDAMNKENLDKAEIKPIKSTEEFYRIDLNNVVPVMEAMFSSSLALNGLTDLVQLYLEDSYKDVKYLEVSKFKSILEAARDTTYPELSKDMINTLVGELSVINPEFVDSVTEEINEIVGGIDEF